MWFLLSASLVILGVIPTHQYLVLERSLKEDWGDLWKPVEIKGDVGAKLLLTPYIESGKIEEGKRLAKVSGEPFFDDIVSYSGYLTVNKTYDSNLFFWFFPAENNYETAPLLLWLQGGPGASSLYGLFEELGPFSVASNKKTLVKNPYSWHKNHSLIFIDNPVGTGFSYTNGILNGYATEETQIGEQLYSAVTQFLKLFPELQKVPFFVAGESYAGKYVPALGHTIHIKNQKNSKDIHINLQGLVVGDGFTDPVSSFNYSDYVYQLGLVDTHTFNKMKQLELDGIAAYNRKNYSESRKLLDEILDTIQYATEDINVYNYMYPAGTDIESNYEHFVESDTVRKAIHVGDAVYAGAENYNVLDIMAGDKMISVVPWLEELLDNYRVLYYNGQLDIIVAYPLSENMYKKLKFNAAEEYRNAERVPWYVDEELAGYMKSAGNFTEVLVRNAGHMVPKDQPKWALNLINSFTSGRITQS